MLKIYKALPAFFLFLTLFLLQNGYGQNNPASPDPSFHSGVMNGIVYKTVLQPDGKILVGGEFTHYKKTVAGRIVRLHPDGNVDTSFHVGTGFNKVVRAIAVQSDGKIIVVGSFTFYHNTIRRGIARLNNDGSLDTGFDPSALTGTMSPDQTILSIAIQSNGKIILGGDFTTSSGAAKNRLARLNTDGSIDNSFVTGSGPSGDVRSIIVQPDDQIILAGSFSFHGASCLLRLNNDGSADNTFNRWNTVGSGTIYSAALQSDGKLIITGDFQSYDGVSRKGVARVLSTGNVDSGFNFSSAVGANNTVYSCAVQSDNKVLIGGWFTRIGAVTQNRIARLNTNGNLDLSFTIGTGFKDFLSATVNSISIQPDQKIILGGRFDLFNDTTCCNLTRLTSGGSTDQQFDGYQGMGAHFNIYTSAFQLDGKIIVGGNFQSYSGRGRNGLARLYPDGVLDTTFNIGSGIGGTAVNSIVIQPDGKIIIRGSFSSYNGESRPGIARINANGTIDASFDPGTGANGAIFSELLQPDGKIIVGGSFSSYNGVSRSGIARINANGTIDTSFDPGTGFNNSVLTIAPQPDGKILVGGNFTSYNDVTANDIVRLNADGSYDNTFHTGTGFNYGLRRIAVTSEGEIVVVGEFSVYNNVSCSNLVRLDLNGNLDSTFNTKDLVLTNGFYGAGINTFEIQSDGKIIIGGQFISCYGYEVNNIARLNSDGTFDINFNPGTGVKAFVRPYLPTVNTISIGQDGKILAGGFFETYNDQVYTHLVILNGDKIFNKIHGKVYNDSNNDCAIGSSEKGIPQMIIKATPGPYYTQTTASGKYQLFVDSGTTTYTISQKFNSIASKMFVSKCQSSHTLNLSGIYEDTCCFDFADSVRTASLLTISIQNTRMRRCFKNNTFVNYCNEGTADASDALIKIEYPPHVVPVSSSPAWTSRIGSVLFFDVGLIPAGACSTIVLLDSVSCANEDIRGLTQCIKASISPAFSDIPNASWDRSSVNVIGECRNDRVTFFIMNKGTGNMSQSREYRVFTNDTLIYRGSFRLQAGESFKVQYPAGRNTMRLEADQDLQHPGRSRPRSTVEGCGIAGVPAIIEALVTTAPLDDLNEEVSITCNMIIDSYDPNDKNTTPKGIGNNHNVCAGEELEYIVRFQNTGTDAAHNVRIVDTLDIALEPGSFVKGTGSHPYVLSVTGKGKAVLTFTFSNINLPDSTTDRAGSCGVLSYRITIPVNTPTGTVIRNKAYIYFDYNSPILTNETDHTVDCNVEEELTRGADLIEGNIVTGPVVVATNPSPMCLPGLIDLSDPSFRSGSTSDLSYQYYSNADATVMVTNSTVSASGVYYIVGMNENYVTDTAALTVVIDSYPFVHIQLPTVFPNPFDITDPAITAGSTTGLTYQYYTDASATILVDDPTAITMDGIYYIVGTKLSGCSDTASLAIGVMNTNKALLTGLVTVYPNPSAGDITVEMSNEGPEREFVLYSSIGGLVGSYKLSTARSQKIALNAFAKGLYHFKIVEGETVIKNGTIQIQ